MLSVSQCKNFSQKFWEDKNGNAIVWQPPNKWLSLWFITMVLGWFLPRGLVEQAIGLISLVALIIWAGLELTKGVNYFRRLIGLLVLLVIIVSRLVTIR